MSAARIFLGLLALLYLVFAALSTLRPREIAGNLGIELPGPSGLCEFLVVYGGLELGLGLFFAFGAWKGEAQLSALWLATLLHGALVAYRAIIVVSSSGLETTIFWIFALEAAIFIAAAFLTIPRGLPA